ncbi:MAG: glycosyltransferase [Rickettsiaceae bacterium]|nr:MAG: glycosyltransferase [Rickettsiaceae bacterium]
MNNLSSQAPMVSIILPTYNREHFIGEAISSVLSQNYHNFELIIVDDGSTDKTHDIVSTFKDSRIKYYYQHNKGRSSARNLALSIACGEYIAFLDSDDLYLKNKLVIQVEYMNNHPETSMIYTSARYIDEEGRLSGFGYNAIVSGFIYRHIAFFLPVTITLPTVMVVKNVFQKVGIFDENMHRFEDTDMWRRISKHFKIDALPTVTCYLRTHNDNSLINQNPDYILVALNYYKDKIMTEDTNININLRRHGLSNLYRYYGNAMIKVPKFARIAKQLLNTADELGQLSLFAKLKKILFFVTKQITNKKTNSLKVNSSMSYVEHVLCGRLDQRSIEDRCVEIAIINDILVKIIEEYDIKILLDASYESWNWMQYVDLGLVKYIKVDHNNQVTEASKQNYNNNFRSFINKDMAKDQLPKSDLIFARDYFTRTNLKEAKNIINNFKKSGAKYLLMTTYDGRVLNNDLLYDNFWRPINMKLAPFNFADPILLMNENCYKNSGIYKDKCLGLWRLTDIKLDSL